MKQSKDDLRDDLLAQKIVKAIKKDKSLLERPLVNKLIKAIQENSHRVYVHIDRDSGAVRHTSSGWDFLLAADGRVIFAEAKTEKGRLSDWQEFIQAQIKAARTPYLVVRFSSCGEFFQINNGKPIKISEARFQDFLDK
jgi:hypothetical protein